MQQDGFPDWISFLDDNGEQINRYCSVLRKEPQYVEFALSPTSPRVILPWHRVLKIKEVRIR